MSCGSVRLHTGGSVSLPLWSHGLRTVWQERWNENNAHRAVERQAGEKLKTLNAWEFLWQPHDTGFIPKAGLDSQTWTAWMSILGCKISIQIWHRRELKEAGMQKRRAKGFLCLCFTTKGWRTRPKHKLLVFFCVIAKKIVPIVSWRALEYYHYCLYFGPL